MRNLLVIAALILLVSCEPSKRENPPKYREIICPKCNGIGKVQADAGDRVVLGLITFGMGAMIDTKQCDMCNGSGTVRQRIIESNPPDTLPIALNDSLSVQLEWTPPCHGGNHGFESRIGCPSKNDCFRLLAVEMIYTANVRTVLC